MISMRKCDPNSKVATVTSNVWGEKGHKVTLNQVSPNVLPLHMMPIKRSELYSPGKPVINWACFTPRNGRKSIGNWGCFTSENQLVQPFVDGSSGSFHGSLQPQSREVGAKWKSWCQRKGVRDLEPRRFITLPRCSMGGE